MFLKTDIIMGTDTEGLEIYNNKSSAFNKTLCPFAFDPCRLRIAKITSSNEIGSSKGFSLSQIEGMFKLPKKSSKSLTSLVDSDVYNFFQFLIHCWLLLPALSEAVLVRRLAHHA